MKRNYNAIDAMKYVCAILVIVVHTSPVIETSPFFNHILINLFGRIAVPFFFISSGYFLRKQMMKDETFKISSYLKKLCKMYLFWSIVYIPAGLHYLNEMGSIPPSLYPVALIVAIGYIGTYFHLWYIPAIMFSTVFVSKLLKKSNYKVLLVVTVLLYLFGCIETYNSFLSPSIQAHVIEPYMRIFITTRNGLLLASFFVASGFFICEFEKRFTSKRNKYLALLFFVFLCIESILLYQKETINMNFLLSLVPFTFFFFLSLLQIQWNVSINFSKLRVWSTYYYYVHAMFIFLFPLILSYFGLDWVYLKHGFIRFGYVLLFTHLMSYILIYLSEKIEEHKVKEKALDILHDFLLVVSRKRL